MKLIDKMKFRIGQWALGGLSRGFSEVAGAGRQMSDWILSGISDDADLHQNWPNLIQKARDLFKLNPYMRKFRMDQIANVFGSEGITLQMKIKEEADRVVYAAPVDGKYDPRQLAEKAWLEAKQRSREEWRQRAMAIQKRRPDFDSPFLYQRQYLTETTTGQNGSTRAKAAVKAGQPDLYANNLIERAWKRWQRAENCTVTRRFTYAQTRHHRITMFARDGSCYIRHVRGFKNEFKYAIQLIAAEWIDHQLNQELDNGHQIKMGIEYDEWGAVVAYYVIKREPGDWKRTYHSSYNRVSENRHERVDARDMIHYYEPDDPEVGESAPRIASVISKLRHLDKYSEAEVISARAEACKGGHYESTIPGTDASDLADVIEKIRTEGERLTQVVEPAMWKPLPFGWKANAHDPRHPSGNFGEFKKECLREICAGIGDQYITFSGDLEGTSYSSGRIGSLDVRELWMLTQQFDIDTAEIPIFEAWLEMALASGAIPLPLTKIEKFKAAQFQGRRWPWVDPLKDAKADQMAIDSMLTSRTRICNENGDDFEEIIEEQAMEKILMEEAGLYVSNSADVPDDDPDLNDDDPPTKPAAEKPQKQRRTKALLRK